MTRFLSHSLQASEPFFRQSIQKLESANGHPNTDIRLSTEILQASRQKIQTLGLDPDKTNPEVVYHVLKRRLAEDDSRLYRQLRTKAAIHISAEAEVVSGMIYALEQLPDSKRCYALKASVLKSLIKKQPPKKAMKQLGYRSLASFLKHESAVSVLASAWLCEGVAWQNKLLDQYKKLSASDFENRNVVLIQPDSKKWRELSKKFVERYHNNLLSFKELGALVFLPLNSNAPSGSTTVSLSLALHELNEIRASSSFLKLCQVRPDFGAIVRSVVCEDPHLKSHLLDKPMPWNLIQRYYSNLTHHQNENVFETHLQLEDMAWHPIEKALSSIESSFEFWLESTHLGVLEREKPVSFNVLDVALNYCNNLAFDNRMSGHFQQALLNELLLRYLHHDSVEQTLLKELHPEFAAELATA